MSAIDRINSEVILALSGIQTIDVTAAEGGGDVDAPGILKADKHQVDVTGSVTVSFKMKGQAAFNTSQVVADTTVTFNLINVDAIKVVSAAGTPAVSIVSYSSAN